MTRYFLFVVCLLVSLLGCSKNPPINSPSSCIEEALNALHKGNDKYASDLLVDGPKGVEFFHKYFSAKGPPEVTPEEMKESFLSAKPIHEILVGDDEAVVFVERENPLYPTVGSPGFLVVRRTEGQWKLDFQAYRRERRIVGLHIADETFIASAIQDAEEALGRLPRTPEEISENSKVFDPKAVARMLQEYNYFPEGRATLSGPRVILIRKSPKGRYPIECYLTESREYKIGWAD